MPAGRHIGRHTAIQAYSQTCIHMDRQTDGPSRHTCGMFKVVRKMNLLVAILLGKQTAVIKNMIAKNISKCIG